MNDKFCLGIASALTAVCSFFFVGCASRDLVVSEVSVRNGSTLIVGRAYLVEGKEVVADLGPILPHSEPWLRSASASFTLPKEWVLKAFRADVDSPSATYVTERVKIVSDLAGLLEVLNRPASGLAYNAVVDLRLAGVASSLREHIVKARLKGDYRVCVCIGTVSWTVSRLNGGGVARTGPLCVGATMSELGIALDYLGPPWRFSYQDTFVIGSDHRRMSAQN